MIVSWGMESSRKTTDSLSQQVSRQLTGFLQPGHRLVVALSGGLDSVVLLHVLRGLRSDLDFRLSAVHVNHQLQSAANDWAAFCARLCRQWQIPCAEFVVTVIRQGGESLEAVARARRYEVLARQEAEWVALAHHQDDQAETVLLQLLRGAGLPGLQAMPAQRLLAPEGPCLVRPLLGVSRAVLHRYAVAQDLEWVEDPSNRDPRHARNFLRQRVGPLLDEAFPAWRATLSRSARHLAQAQAVLEDLSAQDGQQVSDEQGLKVAALHSLTEARAIHLLRWWIRQQGAPACSERRLQEILRQGKARPDHHPEIHWAGWTLVRRQGYWRISPPVGRDSS
ncbi:tRNA(Ile)-lysidine synthase [Ferrovum myxofaciens]|uniref:tRNA(Ile)-lysidine synthase n=3 Tax=root TaxID=1 RepID=A0A149VXK4_9PROT|nr:tRNA(Ile)-lysidine synthase [Ferrovum myxofaciens]